MKRVRVTTLESYRVLLQEEYGSEAELVESIRRGQEGPPVNWKMACGTAWHEVLAQTRTEMCQRKTARDNFYLSLDAALDAKDEMGIETIAPFGCPVCGHWHLGTPCLLLSGDYRFYDTDVATAQRHVGPGVCEVPGSLLVDVAGYQVLLTGTCDRFHGLTIRDAKTKFSPPDARDYEHSLQWRAYLWIFGAQKFLYDLFAMTEPDSTGLSCLGNIVTFGYWRYPGMEQDVTGWLSSFIRWADSKGLTPFLETAGKKAA